LVRETLDRLRQSQEENEMITRRRDELEGRLSSLEAEYEELLGAFQSRRGFDFCVYVILRTEKTIHDEETSNADIANSMTEFKVSLKSRPCPLYNEAMFPLEQARGAIRR
jgi:kinesin family protein 5